jgi:hypothetical protein
MQKVRYCFFQALTACQHYISNFSLTVLVHYQSPKISDFEDGPPIFKQHMTCTILLLKIFQLFIQGISFSGSL